MFGEARCFTKDMLTLGKLLFREKKVKTEKGNTCLLPIHDLFNGGFQTNHFSSKVPGKHQRKAILGTQQHHKIKETFCCTVFR